MGVRKLNKFLQSKNLIKTYNNIGEFINKKRNDYNTNGNIVIAIDTMLYLYKFSYTYDYYIIGFWNQISFLLSHRIIPYYIIDNTYPDEKIQTVTNRIKKKEMLEKKLDDIKSQLENIKELNINTNIITLLSQEREKLEKRIIKIKKNDINLLKDFFNELHIPYYDANEEADMLCGQLYKHGHILSCLSDDTDMLCFGCRSVIKIINSKIHEYDLDMILKYLELTLEQFIDMCILFGCDYLKPNFKIDIDNIYVNIKKHKSLSEILAKNIYPQFNDEKSYYFIDKYENIKRLYENNKLIELKVIPSLEQELCINTVLTYIEYFKCELNENAKYNIIKCINYINNHINNKFLYNNVNFIYKKKYSH